MKRNALPILALASATLLLASSLLSQPAAAELAQAPQFTAVDHLNRTFSLGDSAGKVTIIHITQLESPVCIECEAHMREQTLALAELAGDPDVSLITLNVRKNAYSPEGWTLARDWWDVNVAWNWVEDSEPYEISGLYQEYWDLDGNLANPTLVMIDPEQRVAGVYHVYAMNQGEVDGVQSAESLREDISEIMAGEWTVFRGDTGAATYLGLFVLGILSAFTPCSLFMLFAIISYIVSSGSAREEARKPDWSAGAWVGAWFSLGMLLMFALFGALASYAGLFIESSATASLLVGIALVVLGINIIHPLGQALGRLRGKDSSQDGTKKLLGRLEGRRPAVVGLLFGVLFTVGWTPCALAMVLPVLVLIMSGKVAVIAGVGLMCAFALGRALVVTSFCAAAGGMKDGIYNRFVRAGKWIQPIFGLAMVALGIIYALRYFGLDLW